MCLRDDELEVTLESLNQWIGTNILNCPPVGDTRPDRARLFPLSLSLLIARIAARPVSVRFSPILAKGVVRKKLLWVTGVKHHWLGHSLNSGDTLVASGLMAWKVYGSLEFPGSTPARCFSSFVAIRRDAIGQKSTCRLISDDCCYLRL